MGRKLLLEASSPALPSSSSNSTNHKMRPGVLLLIVILAIIFFLSGLLYLILRCLPRPSTREEEVTDNATSLQRQLQHLFHLQDSGIDQSFIDSLPIFVYKSITGLKNPFDCAVCLCEFQPDDKLRLLPRCAHAFHLECIDTWLLSHSTCPLCRGSLLHLDCSSNCFSPFLHVLESSNENSREPVPEDREASSAASNNTQLSVAGEEENRSNNTSIVDMATRVVPVKLGKFRNVNGAAIAEGSSSSSSNAVDSIRRCRSMGSCEYVVDNSSLLNVVIKSAAKKRSNGSRRQHPYSEQPCHSIRGLDEFEEIDLEGGNSSIAQVKQVERKGTSVTKTWRSLSLKLPSRSADEEASKGPFPPVVGTKSWVSYSWNWRTG